MTSYSLQLSDVAIFFSQVIVALSSKLIIERVSSANDLYFFLQWARNNGQVCD